MAALCRSRLCWVAGERFSSLGVNGLRVMERSVLVAVAEAQCHGLQKR
jgi:hypothetical protein